MLVLSRKAREQIQIGDEVVVTILQVKGQSVRIGIEAPRSVRVLRSELPKHETSDDPQPVASKATGSQPAKAKPRQVLCVALRERSRSRT
jgi:carbon storage regulator CsrA